MQIPHRRIKINQVGAQRQLKRNGTISQLKSSRIFKSSPKLLLFPPPFSSLPSEVGTLNNDHITSCVHTHTHFFFSSVLKSFPWDHFSSDHREAMQSGSRGPEMENIHLPHEAINHSRTLRLGQPPQSSWESKDS